jgi:chloramphenicol-sensitive protein RarD
MTDAPRRDTPSGLLYGVAAYAWWGFVAVYFKLVRSVAPLEILAHRIIWSVAILLVMVTVARRWNAVRRVVTSRRLLGALAASTALIAVNWFVFIWAITRDHMVDASLGYFINPLVNVLLGFLVLRERLRRWEWVSVAIAATAVIWLTVGAGVFPWISLTLAFSFALYGLVRRLAGVASIEGLTIETAILLPLAVGYLVHRASAGTIAFNSRGVWFDLLLVAAGPITALPLLWFAAAVQRLRFATVGLLQYISPTLQFFFAVAVFHEPFDSGRLVAFVMIWIAIVIYSVDNFRYRSAER